MSDERAHGEVVGMDAAEQEAADQYERAEALRAENARLREEMREERELYDLQNSRIGRATKAYLEAHPGHEGMPDLGVVVEWLAQQRDTLREERDALAAALYDSPFPSIIDNDAPLAEESNLTLTWPKRKVLDWWATREPDMITARRIISARDKRKMEEGAKPYRDAIDDWLITSCLAPMKDDETPREALCRIVAWETQVSLDPAVSKDAQKLKALGAAEALEAVSNEPDNFVSTGNPDTRVDYVRCTNLRAMAAAKRKEAKG